MTGTCLTHSGFTGRENIDFSKLQIVHLFVTSAYFVTVERTTELHGERSVGHRISGKVFLRIESFL